VADWIKEAALTNDDVLLPSRIHNSTRLGTRQYARILDPMAYGTHTKLKRTVRYLGIEVQDALELSEQTEV
jgi:hypothetical protein